MDLLLSVRQEVTARTADSKIRVGWEAVKG